MVYILPWITLLAVLVGNCGFWLFCFNRLNAAGFSRKFTKRWEKVLVSVCFLIPIVICALEFSALVEWLRSGGWWPTKLAEDKRFLNGWLLKSWSSACLASGTVLGALWLESRRWLIPPPNLVQESGTRYDVDQLVAGGSTANRTTSLLDSVPGNQITHLEVTRKELLLPRRIPKADGLKIGHISDLHFTGQYRFEHYEFVLDRFAELSPDLVLLTGDIIDYDRYLQWIEPLLKKLQAPLGVAYVLGNHDLRISRPEDLVEKLDSLGFIDLGSRDHVLDAEGLRIELTGNEQPWFERHFLEESKLPFVKILPVASDAALRIGVSHTPDKIHWARRSHCDLLFAGHTHGGHARFPLIGPLLAPSWHGSKFASGVFHLSPTVMHVSRGVAGTHALRWWCPPEVSLITLRSP